MALLKELTEYRGKIMKALCSDQVIVDLLNDRENSPCPDRSLLYKYIFPYARTPVAAKETDTYICFRIFEPSIYNKTFKQMKITFYIFTQQTKIRTSRGLRYDLIGERIEYLFNGSLDLGVGRMNLNLVEDISLATAFYGIALTYAVTEFNRPTIHGDPRGGGHG